MRPSHWEEFVGQERLKHELNTRVEAAVIDVRPLDHVFLYGPSGMGKTTLAHILAARLGEQLTVVQMPVQVAYLERVLRRFQNGILFLDEIHALNRAGQEFLLPLIATHPGSYVQNKYGRKTSVGWITVVAATTERDKVIGPLYNRFSIRPEIDPYSDDEMGQIVEQMALKVDLQLDQATALALGKAAGGVPRNARTLVLATRDMTAVNNQPPTVEQVLEFCRVTPDGLASEHLRYLHTIDALGGLAGKGTLESSLQLPTTALRVIERELHVRGYIEYTPRGRELTSVAYERLHPTQIPDRTRR